MHWHLAATDSHTIHYQITSTSGQQQQHRGQLTGPHSMGGFDPGMLYSIGSSSAFAPLPLIRYGSKPVGAFCKPPWRSISMGCTVGGWLGGWSGGRARTILAQRLCRLSLVGFQRSAGGHVSHRRREQASCCCLRAASSCSRCCSRVRGLGSSHTRDSRISVIPN